MLVRALVMVLALPLLLARKVVAVASHLQGKKKARIIDSYQHSCLQGKAGGGAGCC